METAVRKALTSAWTGARIEFFRLMALIAPNHASFMKWRMRYQAEVAKR